MDQINKNNGSETIVLGGQQYTRGKAAIKREQSGTCSTSAVREQARPNVKGEKAEVWTNAMKQDHKSKNPTTRWNDIVTFK